MLREQATSLIAGARAVIDKWAGSGNPSCRDARCGHSSSHRDCAGERRDRRGSKRERRQHRTCRSVDPRLKSRKKTHRREVSYCTTANGIDINQAIIAQGAALACPRYNTRYLPFEQAAALGAPKKPGRARIAPKRQVAAGYQTSPCWLRLGRTMVKVLLFLGGSRSLGWFPSGVPNVSRRFISCSRQSTDRTQCTSYNPLDEFRWAHAFRCCRRGVDLLAVAYLRLAASYTGRRP